MKINEQLLTEYFSPIKPTSGFESRLFDECMASESIAQIQQKSQQQTLSASAAYQSDIRLLRAAILRRSGISILFSVTALFLIYQLSNIAGFGIAIQFGQSDKLPIAIWAALPIFVFFLLVQIDRVIR